MSEYISGFIVECLKMNKNEVTIDVSRFLLGYKTVNVKITNENLIARITGRLNQVDDNGNVFIELDVFKHFSLFDYSEKYLFKEVKNVIQHELGHTHFM